jgi:hypothetical protein
VEEAEASEEAKVNTIEGAVFRDKEEGLIKPRLRNKVVLWLRRLSTL